MQKIGLRKGEFNESRVAKKENEPKPPLDEIIENTYIGRLEDLKDP